MDIPDPISAVPAPLPDDYQWAFDLAPIGLIVSRHRIIVACNQQVCSLFGTTPDVLLGQSFALLYPSVDEFHRMGERIFQPLVQRGSYQDERVMRRVGGRFAGQVFWCRVSGRALDRAHPHAAGVWSFEELDTHRPIGVELTPREREVASQLLVGRTSKQISRHLQLSPRTDEVHRAHLMRKYDTTTTAALVQKLLAGAP